jgi:putative glycosyltransferase (TIGR04348 family)
MGRIPYLRSGTVKTIIVTPERPDSTLGNSITALRWAQILDRLGHETAIHTEWSGEDCSLFIALHARRSHTSIQRFRTVHPLRPLIVALTGTDLYRDLRSSVEARESLTLASRLVVLQDAALDELDSETRAKASVIYQSAVAPAHRQVPAEDVFEVCVLSHVRDVKDPLRAAFATRQLPQDSRIRILHAGRVLESNWEERVRGEERVNSRYRWLGNLDHQETLQLLARCRLFVLSSIMEGGSSAIAEAVVCGIPILCSDISGNRGMLGSDYAGFFPPKDTSRLAELLRRAETDSEFLTDLQRSADPLKPRFSPEAETRSWRRLLKDLSLA